MLVAGLRTRFGDIDVGSTAGFNRRRCDQTCRGDGADGAYR
ncbi:hypothetical protein I551_8805 [Mycobacterium ulcerans str. Harvey]|uniref:Uncharacterized protein n=1 Tax=Mycobacterium ulcerans str. Harvey TaxID=1299332 RepID=A0ABN0R9V5_MYCUL|nr:hypothetical protein I551_8805 [Mycobacterium ulcerans str. Harvey]